MLSSPATRTQTGPSEEPREELNEARKVLDDKEVILDKLGKARGLAERILKMGKAVSEVLTLPHCRYIQIDAVI